MAEFGAYGNKLGAYLHLDDVPALVARTTDKKPIAITRCRLDTSVHGPTSPIPSEDAYMIVLQTGERSYRELWLDSKPVRTEPHDLCAGDLRPGRNVVPKKSWTPIWTERSHWMSSQSSVAYRAAISPALSGNLPGPRHIGGFCVSVLRRRNGSCAIVNPRCRRWLWPADLPIKAI